MTVIQSSRDASHNSGILLLGAFKAGKTVCSSTISENLESGVLSDLLYVSFDVGGTQSLTSLGREAPTLDVSGLNYKDFAKEWRDGLGESVLARVKSGETKTVIFDTLSTYDSLLRSHYAESWEEIRRAHFKLADYCKMVASLGGRYVVTAHLKSNLGDWSVDEKTTTAKQAAQSEVTNLVFDITGKAAARKWRGQVAHALPVCREDGKHYIFPWGKPGELEGFTRGPPDLPKKMDANLTEFLKLCGEHNDNT